MRQVNANKYDLSASRYRQIEQEPVYYEQPRVTMGRIVQIGRVIEDEVQAIEDLIN